MLVMDNKSNLTKNLPQIFVGESFRSIRPLLKRYVLHSSWGPSGTNNLPVAVSHQTSIFPFNRGSVHSAVHTTFQPESYNYCNTTLLNYFSWMYVGWRGTIRWKIMLDQVSDGGSTNTSDVSSFTTMRNTRPGQGDYTHTQVNLSSNSTDSLNAARIVTARTQTGWEGAVFTPTNLNSTIEADFPYYSRKRFALTRLNDRTSQDYATSQ